MTRAKRKGWFVTALVIGTAVVASAYNADKIKKFIDEKLPFVAGIFKS